MPWAFSGVGVEKIHFPSTLTYVGDHAFAGSAQLRELDLPGSLQEVGKAAFEGCTGLERARIGDRVGALPESCFERCTGLREVTLPDGLRELGRKSFAHCTGLEKVLLGRGLEEVGDSAFCNVASAKVHAPDWASWCNIRFAPDKNYSGKNVRRQCSANPVQGTSELYVDGAQVTEVEIPEGVTAVGENAFNSYDGAAVVRIPSTVTSIGGTAFYACKYLTAV
ncbi:MAG: leucine-rich repeat domain-containing protein [Bacteroidaceae bacterium]|nr:leucine-rich repeat domain-containing protein [Bacteroidaceae bacterium]